MSQRRRKRAADDEIPQPRKIQRRTPESTTQEVMLERDQQHLNTLIEDARRLTSDAQFRAQALTPRQNLAVQQIEQGFIKLPVVFKDIVLTNRGAMFYINNKGKKVYLKKYQREQCLRGALKGSRSSCTGGIPGMVVGSF